MSKHNRTPVSNLLFYFDVSCFERFFRHVNTKEGKLSMKRRGGYVMDDLNLIGVEYLWRVCCNAELFCMSLINDLVLMFLVFFIYLFCFLIAVVLRSSLKQWCFLLFLASACEISCFTIIFNLVIFTAVQLCLKVYFAHFHYFWNFFWGSFALNNSLKGTVKIFD